MFATHAVALSLVTASIPVSPAPPDAADVEQARPRTLTVEIARADPDHVTLDAQFHLATGEPGSLRVEIWEGEPLSVESEFSVRGVPHVWLRQVDGEEPETWLSPDIEADPALMLNYWGVVTDIRLHESTAKNPLCGAMRWGLKAAVWIVALGCCHGGFGVGCVVCGLGANTATDAINNIDCNKECKPDCPIP